MYLTFLMDKYITLFISENLNMSKVLRSLLHIHKMQEVHLKFFTKFMGHSTQKLHLRIIWLKFEVRFLILWLGLSNLMFLCHIFLPQCFYWFEGKGTGMSKSKNWINKIKYADKFENFMHNFWKVKKIKSSQSKSVSRICVNAGLDWLKVKNTLDPI